jgi:TonB-linked SusC/RagA family outer membrane protein
MLLWAVVSYSQQNLPIVKGVVSDSDNNETLIGASVVIKNTRTGTTTDLDGQFQLSNVAPNAVLEISYLGYRVKEVPVNGKTELTVLLEPDDNALEEVVITGYGRIDKRLFTGATDRLVAEDVKINGLAEISRSLEGRSAGVSVQNVSGTFGTRPKIRVRGATSIYGSSNPLWVVDGVIIEDVKDVDADALSSGDAETLISSAIAGLNASDIESFQILKDGSATSIYGAKAMAGVIVVTTKRGKTGSSSINYTGEFTSRLTPNYGEFNIMNSQEQMSVYQEMQSKGWLNLSEMYRKRNSGVYGKLSQLMHTYDPATGSYLIPNDDAAKNAYLRDAEYRNTDWFQELYHNNIMQNHALNISGGTEKSTFYGSVSALLDPGFTVASSLQRFTGTMNLMHHIYKNLTLNLNTKAYYRKQQAPGTSKRTVDAVEGRVNRDFDINPYSYALNTSRVLDPNEFYTRYYSPFNILHELENNYIDLNETSVNFIAELAYEPIKGLEIKALGNIKYTGSSMEHIIKDASNQAMAFRAMDDAYIRANNTFLYDNPDDPLYPYNLNVSVLPVGGILDRDDNRMYGWDFRTSANYSTAFNDGMHLINLFGGMEVNSVDKNTVWNRNWGLQYEKGKISNYDYLAFKKWVEDNSVYYSNSDTRRRETAFFAMANYSYFGRYTINGTARYEGSNQMGRSRRARWLPTWNISGAWNAHEESFFKSLEPAFSHATIRTSYSLTAQAPPLSVSNAAMVIRSRVPWRYYTDDKVAELYITQMENSELTYEKKYELNIGGDLGFANNRVNLSWDWYSRKNFDLIGNISVQGMGGSTDKRANVAEMESHGIEFTLATKNIKTKDFGWNSDFTFSKTNVKITKLQSSTRIIDLVTGNGFGLEGYSFRTLFSIPFAGLNEKGFPTFYNAAGDRVYYINLQNSDADSRGFLVVEGPKEPTFQGGFGNTFSYKNLKFNVFVTYSGGNKLRLDPMFDNIYSDLTAMPKEFANRWMLPGDEAYTNIPTIASNRQTSFGPDRSDLNVAYNIYNYSTVRVADGGFVRLKEISLIYDFPEKILSAVSFKKLSLKLQATNLFLLYADKKLNGQDPEFMNSGGVATPVPKQFTLTIMLGL